MKQTEENKGIHCRPVRVNRGAVSVQIQRSRGKLRERRKANEFIRRYGTIVHVDDENKLRAFDVDEVGKEVSH